MKATGLHLSADGTVLRHPQSQYALPRQLPTCAQYPFKTHHTLDDRLSNVEMGRPLWEDELDLLRQAAGDPSKKAELEAFLRLACNVQDPEKLSLDRVLAHLRLKLGTASAAALDDETLYSPAQLAKKYGVDPERLRKRLERLRKRDHACFAENADRAGNEAQHLYRLGAVNPIIESMRRDKRSGSRPS
jgi:hypothetical protein